MQIGPSAFASMFQATPAAKTAGVTAAGASLLNAQATDGGASARGQFADYMKMTPAEKMHAAMLQRLGVTEEQYKAMSPDERAKIEAQIKDMIEQEVENGAQDKEKTGLFADIKV